MFLKRVMSDKNYQQSTIAITNTLVHKGLKDTSVVSTTTTHAWCKVKHA